MSCPAVRWAAFELEILVEVSLSSVYTGRHTRITWMSLYKDRLH
jgi:hypothetical protein